MESIFRSARLKLTLFYLVILVALSLTLTFGFRLLAEHEYARSSSTQYGQVRHLFIHYPFDLSSPDSPQIKPEVAFGRIQTSAEADARARLNRDFVLVTLAALMVGGVLSYWFAGRTLKPIEEAHVLQARFAADASHELRTPLANMKVENEVFLRQKGFTEKEAREQIESNLEEVQRLEQLATGLLDLTQYDLVSLELEPVSTANLVDAAIQAVQPQADAKHIRFVKHIDVDTKVFAHAESATQLLKIVLENAIKYSPGHTTVTLQDEHQTAHMAISITDEGGGISEQDLPYIFDRLYRGDKARTTKTGGYGLGLALAKQIAQANHAAIAAENTKKGACFTAVFELAKG
jgi:two-component system sensor histidine kinase CiaH